MERTRVFYPPLSDDTIQKIVSLKEQNKKFKDISKELELPYTQVITNYYKGVKRMGSNSDIFYVDAEQNWLIND